MQWVTSNKAGESKSQSVRGPIHPHERLASGRQLADSVVGRTTWEAVFHVNKSIDGRSRRQRNDSGHQRFSQSWARWDSGSAAPTNRTSRPDWGRRSLSEAMASYLHSRPKRQAFWNISLTFARKHTHSPLAVKPSPSQTEGRIHPYAAQLPPFDYQCHHRCCSTMTLRSARQPEHR